MQTKIHCLKRVHFFSALFFEIIIETIPLLFFPWNCRVYSSILVFPREEHTDYLSNTKCSALKCVEVVLYRLRKSSSVFRSIDAYTYMGATNKSYHTVLLLSTLSSSPFWWKMTCISTALVFPVAIVLFFIIEAYFLYLLW